MKWRHCGFNVFCGDRIQPGDEKAMANLARYIVGVSFSQETITPYPVRGRLYIPEESKVIYQSKNGKEEKVFDALEWPRIRRRDAPQAGCKHKHSLPRAAMFRIRENPADGGSQILRSLFQCGTR